MARIAVVYWSGTGHTKAMAEAVAQAAGAEIYTPADFSDEMVDQFDAIAFGCPSMGAEELEDAEFAPMFEGVKPRLSGKKVALFGSYGWGDGEWMRAWEADCLAAGAELAAESAICSEEPDAEAIARCTALGKALL